MLVLEKKPFVLAFSDMSDKDLSFYAFSPLQAFNVWQSLPVAKRYGLNAPKWALQVHKNRVLKIGAEGFKAGSEEADGLITGLQNCPIGVFSADCLPVLLYSGSVCAAVHAGWKSTLKNIASEAVTAFLSEYNVKAGALTAVLGPCINECCLEMGQEVYEAFINANIKYERCFITKGGRPYLNLRALNRLQLINAGLKNENITDINVCTFCSGQKYFSYRRQRKRCGSMFSFIARL